MRARGGAAWDGLVDRGMAVDFDWTTGSAPRYVEAYRRASRSGATEAQPPRAWRIAAVVSTGCVRCGECGEPGIVRT